MTNKLFTFFFLIILISSCSSSPEYLSEDIKNIYLADYLASQTPHFKSCFEDNKRNNIDEGVVKISFVISSTGEIKSSKTSIIRGIINKDIIECLDKTTLNFKFPPTTVGEIVVNQPLNFYPQKKKLKN